MAFLDHEGGTEYDYPKKNVFDAIVQTIPNVSGMKIDNADETGGRITVKAGVSLTSWGENIPITLTEITPMKTRVSIISAPKTGIMFGGAFDFGKNRKNIERILEGTSKYLSELPKSEIQERLDENDPKQKLVKLKELFDQQLISEEDYESQKSKILSEL